MLPNNMDKQELKNLTKEELENKLGLLREKTRVLRFKVSSGNLKNTHIIKETRKTIAQMLTLLRDKK